MYVLYTVEGVESVKGDIDICFVYCCGGGGCLICTRSYRCMFCILFGSLIGTR